MLVRAYRVWKTVSLSLMALGLGIFLMVRLGPWGMYVMPTGSMEESLLIGDHIWVSDFSGRAIRGDAPLEVERGDVIVFRLPPNPEEIYAKRLIGLPGDRLRFDERRLTLNGQLMDEPYTVYKDSRSDVYRDNFPAGGSLYASVEAQRMLSEHVVDGELVVPPEHYFFLGDNRDRSSDSRYWGFVPRENFMGRVERIYWSVDRPSSYDDGGDETTRWERIGMRVVHEGPTVSANADGDE